MAFAAEDLDGPPHGGDLVGSGNRHEGCAPAAGDLDHHAAQARQARHDIAPDIEPDDQQRTGEAQSGHREQHLPAQRLNLLRFGLRFVHFVPRCGDERVDGARQPSRQRRVLFDEVVNVVF